MDCLDCLGLRLRSSRTSAWWHRVSSASYCALRRLARERRPEIWMGGPMATYWPTEQRELSRAMHDLRRNRDPRVPQVGRADVNAVCASCGMTLVESPFQARDYFDVIMRVGRPIRRGARLRRTG